MTLIGLMLFGFAAHAQDSTDVVNTVAWKEITSGDKAVFFYTTLFCLILITLSRSLYPKDMRMFLLAAFNRNSAQMLFKSSWGKTTFFSVMLDLNFYLVIPMFVYTTMEFLEMGMNYGPFLQIPIILSVIGVLLFLKFIGLSFLKMIFELGVVVDYYLFEIFYTIKLLGMVVFPFLVIAIFAPDWAREPSIYIGWGLTGILLIFSYLKVLGSQWNLILRNQFHFLLYICGLEIVPVFLLLRLSEII